MVKKTIKEVDTEVVILKSEFNDLKLKYDDLSEKFVNLEKRHEQCNVASQCSIVEKSLILGKTLTNTRKFITPKQDQDY